MMDHIVPTKLISIIPIFPEHYIIREKKEWTPEEKLEVLKDSNVRNILHSSLDYVLSNRMISCKTVKEIWDTLETQCQGTMAIKENKRVVLIQEYEHFQNKADESLTDTYDIFLTLMNNISLVGKEY